MSDLRPGFRSAASEELAALVALPLRDYAPRAQIRRPLTDVPRAAVPAVDVHNHVGRCYHGRRPLQAEKWRALYLNEKIRLSLPRFAWIDTLFSLPEACLYAEIIEAQEAKGEAVDYHRLYDEGLREFAVTNGLPVPRPVAVVAGRGDAG